MCIAEEEAPKRVSQGPLAQGPVLGFTRLCCLAPALARVRTGQWRCLGVGDRSGQWFPYNFYVLL